MIINHKTSLIVLKYPIKIEWVPSWRPRLAVCFCFLLCCDSFHHLSDLADSDSLISCFASEIFHLYAPFL